MPRTRRIAAALFATIPALLLGGTKPAPTPISFTPALSYRYNFTEIRLANADGSAAALLIRIAPTGNAAVSILQHAIAPLSRRQVAFVEAPSGSTKSIRLVSWTQPTPGGPLSVTLDPTPLFTISAEITSLDYSPDGATLAAVSWVNGLNQEVRFFDVATRMQIGDAVPLASDGSVLRWRSADNSLLMRGSSGVSTLQNGVQTDLFAFGSGGWFDSWNGTATDVLLQTVVSGSVTLQRWDGATLIGCAPPLTTFTQGYHASVSCDNARFIFQRGSPRTKTIVRSLTTGTETAFSQDNGISFPAYPNGCG